MLCVEFNDRLTDYLEGALAGDEARRVAEHALRCPVCHDLLNEVRLTVSQCNTAREGYDVPAPAAELEARILQRTTPELQMTCTQFEEHLTDYLDGFLPAALYHRWERHAALCERCTELPGAVVRSIGACYSTIAEPLAVPENLHAKILQATLGTTDVAQVRAPLAARLRERVQGWFDDFSNALAPQFAPVATMALFVVLVGATTLSEDGSISGMYRAGLRLATQTYARGAGAAVRGTSDLPGDLKRVADDWTLFIGASPARNENSNDKVKDEQNAGTPAAEREAQQQQSNANKR